MVKEIDGVRGYSRERESSLDLMTGKVKATYAETLGLRGVCHFSKDRSHK